MSLFKELFTWWDGGTWGTRLLLRRRGEAVGDDSQGNRYFRQRGGTRRWVLYNGAADASRIPPEWHAWLHFITPEPPSTAPLPVKPWEREHLPNLTGTPDAHRPPGSLAGQPVRSAVSGGYQAWRPDA